MSENVIIETIAAITAIATTTITGVIGYNFTKKNKEKKDENNNANLNSHPVFNRIDFNKSIIINSFRLENKGKEIIFKCILLNHMEIYKKNIMDLVEKFKREDINSEEIYSSALATLNFIIFELNNFYKDDETFTHIEKKALKIVMSKYSIWNLDREYSFISRVQEVCNSNVYQTNEIKKYLLIDTFSYMISDTINDASKTLNQINGDLSGLKFKGVVI